MVVEEGLYSEEQNKVQQIMLFSNTLHELRLNMLYLICNELHIIIKS